MLILVVLKILPIQLHAQDPIEHFEFVSIKKPNRHKLFFKFKDRSIKTIAVDIEFRVKSKPVEEPGSNDFLQAFFSSTPVSVQVICNPIGKIVCDNSDLSWEVPVFCPGVMQTVEDTSASDHVLRSFTTMNWKEGANGFIIEKADTIGDFIIISDPQTNPKVSTYSEVVYRSQVPGLPEVEEKNPQRNLSSMPLDYGIIGNLNGKPFALLFNGTLRQAWLFRTPELHMVFYTDFDGYINEEKRQKTNPLIQWRPLLATSEKHDLMRMAMMSKFLSDLLTKGYY